MKNLKLSGRALLGVWAMAVSTLAAASVPASAATGGELSPTQPAPTQSGNPQLTILSPELAPHVQVRHLTGANYVVDVRVSNTGRAFSGPFQTRTRISTYGWGWRTVIRWGLPFQVWGLGWDQEADFVTLMNLGPASYKDLSRPAFDYADSLVPRAIRVEVSVDTGNVVHESNEANNSTMVTFELPSGLQGL